MNRLTKMYPNGKITLEAAFFPPINQNTLDSEIRNSIPFKVAVKKLKEYEDRDSEQCEMCSEFYKTNISGEATLHQDEMPDIYSHIKYCPACGRKLLD